MNLRNSKQVLFHKPVCNWLNNLFMMLCQIKTVKSKNLHPKIRTLYFSHIFIETLNIFEITLLLIAITAMKMGERQREEFYKGVNLAREGFPINGVTMSSYVIAPSTLIYKTKLGSNQIQTI